MNIALLPSLATDTSEIPAKGLLGLVLRTKFHMLPCSKLWEPGTGNPASREAASVVWQVTAGRVLMTRGTPCAAHAVAPSTCRRAAGNGTAETSGEAVLSRPQAACLYQVLLSASPSLTNPSRASSLAPAAAVGLHKAVSFSRTARLSCSLHSPRASTPRTGYGPNRNVFHN